MIRQLTASNRRQLIDTMTKFAHDQLHPPGESATRPLVLRKRVLAAVLLIAGVEPASSSRLASPRLRDPLGRVQLPNQG